MTTLVDPFLFCNPVDKNGEGIQNPDDHLACFLTQPPGGVLGALVPILNQFLAAPANINLSEPFAFCLPSTKRLPPGIPALPPWGLAAIAGVTLGAAWALGVRWRARRRT